MPPISDSTLRNLRTDRLPSLPNVLLDVLTACQEQQASFQDLSRIISRDAAITARVVSMANASYYSRGRTIDSLERALFILGTETVKTIVITAAIQQFFSSFNTAHHRSFMHHFWRRSLTCALLARSLAILTSYHAPDEAYLGGLLHNIGELVLHTNYPDAHAHIVAQHQEQSRQLREEQAAFSCTRADVGAHLFKEWGLSEFAADAVAHQFALLDDVKDAHHLVKVLYAAAQISARMAPSATVDEQQTETASDRLGPEEHRIADQLFELNPSLMNEIAEKIAREVRDLAQSMGLKVEPAKDDAVHQVALARHIRNIGLMHNAQDTWRRADTSEELERALRGSVDLLFGFRHSRVFWLSEETDELVMLSPQAPEETLRIKRSNARSIVAQAARERSITQHASESANAPVVDQQLLRLLNTQTLCCIPMCSEERLCAVLVAASPKALASSSPQYSLLQLFAREAGSACAQHVKAVGTAPDPAAQESKDALMQQVRELAHEASNPLSIIGNYLGALADKLQDRPELTNEIDIVQDELARAGQILYRLRDLEAAQTNIPDADVNKEITALVQLFRQSLFLPSAIRCHLQLEDGLDTCKASRNALRQMLSNLVKNAVEAMPGGGEITIATSPCVDAQGNAFVEIRIRDTGPGLPTHVLNNLFTPIASTKGKGHSGLGLSITKNLVTDAGGIISCRSNKQGTEFQIQLPTTS